MKVRFRLASSDLVQVVVDQTRSVHFSPLTVHCLKFPDPDRHVGEMEARILRPYMVGKPVR